MSYKKIRLGILGGGGDSLIGILHRVASSMYDKYEFVGGVFSQQKKNSIDFANELGIRTDRIYANLDEFIESEKALPEDERMEVVSVLTPNFLHYPMAKKLLQNGFHVICEKPLTLTYAQAEELKEIYDESNSVFAVTYTYTGYPMVRQMKQMIANGDIGTIQKVDVQYYQGWINPVIHDEELRANTWRLNPEKGGISCCIGDIGTHGFDMIEYVTGLKLDRLLADLNYLYDDNKMDVDGTVLLQFDKYTKGVLRTSQIATGEENNFTVSVYGDEAGLKWEQENPNYLYKLQDGEPIQVYKPGHEYNSELSLDGTKLPPGHPEGIFDSMGNIYKGVARAIRNKDVDAAEFPSLDDGLRGMYFIEKVVESHQKGNRWVSFDLKENSKA